jgi:hypothetical protein
MERKRLFEPGDFVTSFTGQAGIVLGLETLGTAREHLREGRRPGHFFAPGCCHNPDYVLQIPVLFEDETFDVMRAMNIRKTALTADKKARIQALLNGLVP